MDLSKEDLVDKDIFKLKICFHISRDIYNKSYPRKIWLLHEDWLHFMRNIYLYKLYLNGCINPGFSPQDYPRLKLSWKLRSSKIFSNNIEIQISRCPRGYSILPPLAVERYFSAKERLKILTINTRPFE